MQEEVTREAIAITLKASRLTAQTLAAALQFDNAYVSLYKFI